MTSPSDTLTQTDDLNDEDAANIGRALMDRLPKGYSWMDCPTEIVTDLQNKEYDLREALKDLCRAYVSLMETGRDRIVAQGGDCDSVEVMERGDPYLRKAREALA